jgi:hypothetical protein
MVEVFKTNVQTNLQAMQLISELQCHFPDGIISFDLEDCDKPLRIESECCDAEKIIELISARGFCAEVLAE